MHYENIKLGIENQRLIPFLGAACSFVGAPQGSHRPPSAHELRDTLIAKNSDYEGDGSSDQLIRVSEWLQTIRGKKYLLEALSLIFNIDFSEPLFVPQFVAKLASNAQDKPFVIFTTNYDGIVERELTKQSLNYVVVSHIPEDAPSDPCSLFVIDSNKNIAAKVKPNDLDLADYNRMDALIYKPHGNLYANIDSKENDVVISETDYINVLERGMQKLIPAQLAAYCSDRGFLFMGYSLSDWNMRSLIRSTNPRDKYNRPLWPSYLVDRPNPEALKRYWGAYGIHLQEDDLVNFCNEMSTRLGI